MVQKRGDYQTLDNQNDRVMPSIDWQTEKLVNRKRSTTQKNPLRKNDNILNQNNCPANELNIFRPAGKFDSIDLKKKLQQTKKFETLIFQKVRPQTRENILKSYNLNSEL